MFLIFWWTNVRSIFFTHLLLFVRSRRLLICYSFRRDFLLTIFNVNGTISSKRNNLECQVFNLPRPHTLFYISWSFDLSHHLNWRIAQIGLNVWKIHANPRWPDMQIILCTINSHTIKKACGNAFSFLFFFYGHSIESLSAIICMAS